MGKALEARGAARGRSTTGVLASIRAGRELGYQTPRLRPGRYGDDSGTTSPKRSLAGALKERTSWAIQRNCRWHSRRPPRTVRRSGAGRTRRRRRRCWGSDSRCCWRKARRCLRRNYSWSSRRPLHTSCRLSACNIRRDNCCCSTRYCWYSSRRRLSAACSRTSHSRCRANWLRNRSRGRAPPPGAGDTSLAARRGCTPCR